MMAVDIVTVPKIEIAVVGQIDNGGFVCGHISLIGVLTGISGDVPTAALFSANVTVSGITVGSRQHQIDMIAAINASGLKPILDKDFTLEEIATAFGHQASQQHFGKITLSI
jgi:NADPH:quinone reductase-like Zn-dependent oxidoreductase